MAENRSSPARSLAASHGLNSPATAGRCTSARPAPRSASPASRNAGLQLAPDQSAAIADPGEKPPRVGLIIELSNRSRPRWPIEACYRRRGHVPSVAGIQARPPSCAGARLSSLPALAPARACWRLAVLPVTTGAGSLSWMSRAACRQADPELFFPIAAVTGPVARQVEAAKAVCGLCAVRADCLSYSLEVMPEGIWGGTTPEERRAARGASLRRARHAASQQVPAPAPRPCRLGGLRRRHGSAWSPMRPAAPPTAPPAAAGVSPRGEDEACATDRGGRTSLPRALALYWTQRLNGADLNKKTPVLHCALYFQGAAAQYLKWYFKYIRGRGPNVQRRSQPMACGGAGDEHRRRHHGGRGLRDLAVRSGVSLRARAGRRVI